MRIHVKARSFFEARQGGRREVWWFRTHRIISINNVSFPAEPPPFSREFLDSENLLALYFDDVEDGPAAMTPEQAKQIADFVCTGDKRPLAVHCSAGISRSGAVGEVLNWYFNRCLADNEADYREFKLRHPDLVPNAHVQKLLLAEFRSRNQWNPGGER